MRYAPTVFIFTNIKKSALITNYFRKKEERPRLLGRSLSFYSGLIGVLLLLADVSFLTVDDVET